MSRKKHQGPHKYQRIKWGKNETIVWRCVLPECTHYVQDKFIFGKNTVCWNCGATCSMDALRCTRARPTCNNCINKKRKIKEEETTPLDDLNALLGGLDKWPA